MRNLPSFFIGTGLAAFVCISPSFGQDQPGNVAPAGSVNPAAKTAPIGATDLGPNSPATGVATQANVSQENTDRATTGGRMFPAGDRHFVHAAAQGGMFEVTTGHYAGHHAASYDVRSMARQIARDHARLGDQLGQIARSKGLHVPMQLDAEHQAMVNRLEATPTGSFDSAYLAVMAKAHRKDIAAFEMEANQGSDADLRAFARQALPTLRAHLQMVESNMGH